MELFIVLLPLAVVVTDILWSYSENQKFIKSYPTYSGKFLWTLIFFPIFYLVGMWYWDITLINSIFLSSGIRANSLTPNSYTWNVLALIIFIVATYFIGNSRKSLNKALFNWSEDKKREIRKQMANIIISGTLAPIVYAIGTYLSLRNDDMIRLFYGDALNNGFFSIFVGCAFAVLISLAIWKAATSKIDRLSEIIETPESETIETSN